MFNEAEIKRKISKSYKYQSMDILDDLYQRSSSILQLQPKAEQVNIKIIDTRARGHHIMKYVAYILKVDSSNKITVERRYRQFSALRQAMISRWPGCIVPILPPKHLFNSNTLEIVNQRKKYLTYFLNCIAKIQYLYQSEQFDTFLHTRAFDVKYQLESLPKQTFAIRLEKYKKTFSSVKYDNQKQLQHFWQHTALPYCQRLKSGKIPLINLRKQINRIAIAKERYMIQSKILYNQTLPEYQQYISGHHQKYKSPLVKEEDYKKMDVKTQQINFFRNKNEEVSQIVGKLAYDETVDLYWLVFQAMNVEIMEQETAQQAIQSCAGVKHQHQLIKKKIETNKTQINDIQKGNFSLKNILSTESKQNRTKMLKRENQFLQGQQKAIEQFYRIALAVLLQKTIPQYKQRRALIWKSVIRRLAESQQQYAKYVQKMLQRIVKDS